MNIIITNIIYFCARIMFLIMFVCSLNARSTSQYQGQLTQAEIQNDSISITQVQLNTVKSHWISLLSSY